jgi:hypothetical protein
MAAGDPDQYWDVTVSGPIQVPEFNVQFLPDRTVYRIRQRVYDAIKDNPLIMSAVIVPTE